MPKQPFTGYSRPLCEGCRTAGKPVAGLGASWNIANFVVKNSIQTTSPMIHRTATYSLITLFLGIIPLFASPSAINIPRSRSANIGVLIRDLSTGKDLVAENSDKFLTPASILKCVTAAAVLLDGHENDKFLTETTLNGEIGHDGTFYGDIVIQGVGDPTTESRQFPENYGMTDSIATRIGRLGIKRITGGIVIDSIGFKNQGPVAKWEVEDLKWSYGAGLFPLNYHDNSCPGDRALTEPGETFVDAIENRLRSDSITLEWHEVDNPYAFPRELYTHRSPAVKSILRTMMEKSNNLYAEGMLRLLSPGGTMAEALKRERTILSDAGFDIDALVAFDGSGLTRNSKLTPRFMADLLEKSAAAPSGSLYVSLFPKAGVEGTVKRLLCNTPLQGELALKSGSMNGVQCYAGYKLGPDGSPTHVVVIMVNDFICKRSLVTKAISDFLLRQFN